VPSEATSNFRLGRLAPIDCRHANVRAIGAQPSARALIANFRFPYFADRRPAEAPEGKLDGGEEHRSLGSRRGLSKSLARRRLRPNQEKVRSTTQRRGSTDEAFHVVSACRSPCAAAAPFLLSINLPRIVATIIT